MNVLVQPAGRAARGGAPATLGLVVLLLAVATATVVAVVAGGGNPVVAVTPVALVVGVYLLAKVPLRWSAAALLALMLTLDDTSETFGHWRTPLALVGDMLHSRLDAVIGIPKLAVTGMEVIVLFLFGVWIYRKATGARVDAPGEAQSATVLRDLVLLYVAGVLFAELNGLARGLPAAPWKLRNLLHPAMLFFLFQAAFGGARDHRLLGRIVVFAACVKAVLAFIVQRIAVAETGGAYATATSHGDSVLFSVAAFLLLADLAERPDRGRLVRAALLLPIILVGMVENDRRIVWVMLVMMLILAYVISPMKGWKRWLTRLLVMSTPLIALYVGVGWDRGSKVFAPVRTLRSVSDSSVDHSAYWREVEIWNIAMSMRERPLLGVGLGGEYTESMKNDDISSVYKEYRQWPHNTVLGLLLLMGLFAFTATWALMAAVVFLGVRSFRMATTPDQRVAALGCLGAVIACYVMAYGDTGAHYPQHKIFAALAIAVVGKLAVVTGAWPKRLRRIA